MASEKNTTTQSGGAQQSDGGYNVSITSTYWIAGEEPQKVSQTFDKSTVEAARVGLPEGAKPVKPQPGDFGYSGMHDQGELPPLREGGDIAVLIGCVEKAKEFNDEFLTAAIKKEKKKGRHQLKPSSSGEESSSKVLTSNNNGSSEELPFKKTKIEGGKEEPSSSS